MSAGLNYPNSGRAGSSRVSERNAARFAINVAHWPNPIEILIDGPQKREEKGKEKREKEEGKRK